MNNFNYKKYLAEGKLLKESTGLDQVETKVLSLNSKPYWADKNLNVVNKKVLQKYIKDGYDIEVMVETGFFEGDENNEFNYKTIVKVFKDGNLVKRKLFFTANDKWKGMSTEDLINITLNKDKQINKTNKQKMDNFDLKKYLAEGKLLKEDLAEKAESLEMNFMDPRNKFGSKWQKEVADVLVRKYDGRWENWINDNPKELEMLLNKFDNLLKEGKLLKEEQGENDEVVAFLNANVEAVKQHMRDEFFDDDEDEAEYNEEMGEEISNVTSFEGIEPDEYNDDLVGAGPSQGEIGISYMLKDDYDALEDKTRFETDNGFPPADVKVAGRDLKFITYSI